MRRFPQDALLRGQPLDAALVERIAEAVARFHSQIPSVDPGEPHGISAAVISMREKIRDARDPEELVGLDRIEAWIEARFEALRPRLVQRRAEGRVRECHGDMHSGNIAQAGELVIFDGIEFNPALRWIDTMSELAFLLMDLEHGAVSRSWPDAAWNATWKSAATALGCACSPSTRSTAPWCGPRS